MTKNIKVALSLLMSLCIITGSVCSNVQIVYAYEQQTGEVTGDNVNVRVGAGTDKEAVTQLNRDTKVTVIGEAKDANGVIWYQISFTKDGTAMKGYMHCDYIFIVRDYESKSGKVTGDNVNIREGAGTVNTAITKLSSGHKVTITGEDTASNGSLWYQITFTKDSKNMEGFIHSDYVEIVEDEQTTEEPKESAAPQATTAPQASKAPQATTAPQASKAPQTSAKPQTSTAPQTSATPEESETPGKVTDTAYEEYLNKQGFPESYKKYLRKLHEENPLWIFVALPTGLKWETVVAKESKLGTNLVPASSITSFKSLCEGAINWSTGKWVGFDTVSWVPASESVIRYYMDPRNFLNSQNTILQFESLKYEEGVQTKAGVENILKGTYMEKGKTGIYDFDIDFAQIFMDVGKEYNVSPYHLATRVRQETGVNGSNSSKQIKSSDYSQFNGYYNFFNIGASPSSSHDAMYNGLTRAKKEGWNTPKKSISGGTKIIAEKYIARGQNTLYLQKFDVVDGGDGYYSHQYMTNLLAAASEAKNMEKTYADFNESAITYIIPVYLNMPSEPMAKPTDNGSPYSVLSDLSVADMTMNKEFEEYTFEYTVKAVTKADSVKVSASAYAPDATITGTGNIKLKSGKNTISVVCKGSDGSSRTYKIHITKEEEVVETPKPQRKKGDVYKDETIDVMDALAILRASAKLLTLDEEGTACADVNGNGQVEAQDALRILQYITGQRTEL